MNEGNLFINNIIIYDTIYGCSKQNIRENATWLLSVLTFTHRRIVDRFINDTGGDGSKIGGINGFEKTYLKRKTFMIVTEE